MTAKELTIAIDELFKENTKGYANLEDKGRKVPVEQNRPEDLM